MVTARVCDVVLVSDVVTRVDPHTTFQPKTPSVLCLIEECSYVLYKTCLCLYAFMLICVYVYMLICVYAYIVICVCQYIRIFA